MLFPTARSDRYRGASVGAVMRQLARGGFAPLVRLTHERNHSTIAFYDYRRLRVEFGFTRAF